MPVRYIPWRLLRLLWHKETTGVENLCHENKSQDIQTGLWWMYQSPVLSYYPACLRSGAIVVTSPPPFIWFPIFFQYLPALHRAQTDPLPEPALPDLEKRVQYEYCCL